MPNDVGGRFTVVTVTPEIAYRFPRQLSVRARAPIHYKTFDETTPEVHREVGGLGDVELLGGYELATHSDATAPRWRLALSAGVALPTGKHRVQPFVGDVAPTPLQLGAGTLDPFLGLVVEHRVAPRWSVDTTGATRLAVMENMHDYRPASLFEVGVGGAFRAIPGRLGLELHGEWSHVTHVSVAGVDIPNTGRDTIYASPSANVRIWGDLHLGLTARIPVYLRVNETQFSEGALFAARIVYRTQPLFGGPP